MRIIVSDIPDDGLYQELDFPVVLREERGPEVIHGSLHVQRLKKRVLIDGNVRAEVALTCSRCLQEFRYPVEMKFRDEYLPSEGIDEEGEQELTTADLDLGYYSNDEIDLAEVVKEQTLLSLPMKPLCRTDCPGMCPNCGADLQKGDCGCSKTGIDPRLAPLEKFKDLLKERKE